MNIDKLKNKEKELPILVECVAAARDLLGNYWNRVAEVREQNDGKLSVRITFKIDATGLNPKVKSRLGFSRNFSDERETVVNPAQTDFNFAGPKTAEPGKNDSAPMPESQLAITEGRQNDFDGQPATQARDE